VGGGAQCVRWRWYPVSRDLLRELAAQFQNSGSGVARKNGKRRSWTLRLDVVTSSSTATSRGTPANQIVCIFKTREPARIMTVIENQKENRHLELKQP